MEDSFKVRVEKVFGSLVSSASSSSSSLWSLTDEEIKRQSWIRNKDLPDDEPTPFPSKFDGFFASQERASDKNPLNSCKGLEDDIQDLESDDNSDDEHVQGSSDQSVKLVDCSDEEWDVRSSIGLDCTLDYEEEEDAYDKVAVGREKAGDRLYMRDIADYEICSSYNELPDSFNDVSRDPRANHMAAKIRLKEDAEAAGSFDSLRVSEKIMPSGESEYGGNLKSILKRREDQINPRSQKRVRFDPECKMECEVKSEGAEGGEVAVAEEVSPLFQEPFGVPDYIRNPSKYTHYTFDSSSDLDEESNRQAYMDFLNMVKRSKTTHETCIELPKSVIFTPQKKEADAVANGDRPEAAQKLKNTGKDYTNTRVVPISISVENAIENEVSAMEEDEAETAASKGASSQRPGRQYRTKANLELEESDL